MDEVDTDFMADLVSLAGGPSMVARMVGFEMNRSFTHQAVNRWVDANRLPLTDHVGTTKYASILSKLVKGHYTKKEILAASKASWHNSIGR